MDIERVGSRGLRLFYGEGNLSQEVLLPDYSHVLSKADQYAVALIVVAICLVGFCYYVIYIVVNDGDNFV